MNILDQNSETEEIFYFEAKVLKRINLKSINLWPKYILDLRWPVAELQQQYKGWCLMNAQSTAILINQFIQCVYNFKHNNYIIKLHETCLKRNKYSEGRSIHLDFNTTYNMERVGDFYSIYMSVFWKGVSWT